VSSVWIFFCAQVQQVNVACAGFVSSWIGVSSFGMVNAIHHFVCRIDGHGVAFHVLAVALLHHFNADIVLGNNVLRKKQCADYE
jgi:hypothetical protein